MTQFPLLAQVEYLVSRRFPQHKALSLPLPLSATTGTRAIERQHLLQQIEEYRATLKAKSVEDLLALFQEEQAKEREGLRLKAAMEEARRFFNLPNAMADFAHWSKAMYWTLEEAVALAFGKAPEVVSWDKVQDYTEISPFARQYARVRDLAIRARNWNQLYDQVMPGIFLAWARRTEIDVPEELVRAVEARGIVVADWKDLHDQLKVRFDALIAERDKLVELSHELIGVRDALNGRVAELEEQATAWQFDESAENYPLELDIAMQAWWAISKSRDPLMTVKQQLMAWLDEHYARLATEAKERIATICNWEKRGGRPAAG